MQGCFIFPLLIRNGQGSRSTNHRIGRPTVDGAHVDASLHDHVAGDTPGSSPRVADDPEIAMCRVRSVSDDIHSVINGGSRARWVVKETRTMEK